MDVIAAYREVGSYRGAAAICGTTHKTVRRIVEQEAKLAAGEQLEVRASRERNFDAVADLVAAKVKKTAGRISAKRLLPAARAAGYEGSARNFRRLVADAKTAWRQGEGRSGRGRRPAIWTPGETLVIDWGVLDVEGRRLHVFCAVLAWSRVRFVRFADDEKAATTLAFLAECFETLGGVPKVVLTDRMGCLKGGVVANVMVPTPEFVRFATHYGFPPDFCEAADPESKGMVESLARYAQQDLLVPVGAWATEPEANDACRSWCEEVNAVVHSTIAAVPALRLAEEAKVLRPLPSLRPPLRRGERRRVDK